MVPQPRTSLSRTAGSSFSGDDGNAGTVFSRQRRPLITYGKKDTRPLPLTTDHFRRRAYNIAPHEAEDEDSRGRNIGPSARAGVRAFLKAATDDSSNSGLSGEPDQKSVDEVDGSQSLLACRSAGAKAAQPIVLSSTGMQQAGTAYSVGTPKSSSLPVIETRTPAPKRMKRSPEARLPAHPTRKTPRQLPVNELVLVASPMENTNFEPPSSSLHSIQTQDSIDNRTISAREADLSPFDSDGNLEIQRTPNKQPSSAFKKSLRPDKPRYKSVIDLRKKRAEQCPSDVESPDLRGDGFNAGELHISPLARRATRKRRTRQDPMITGFNALQLQSGPLPDVIFEFASSPLELEAKHASPRPAEHARLSRPSKRQDVFSKQAREEVIIAQLSLIAAPPAPQPISDDGDDDEESEDEDGDGDEQTEVDEDQIADGLQAIADDEVSEAETDDLEARYDEQAACLRVDASKCTLKTCETSVSEGVSLDFRRLVPGQWPRRRITQERLMEINERITEVPDTEILFTQLVEHVEAPRLQTNASEFTPDILPPPRSQLKRPRSILKQSGEALPERTTQAEHTAANTRRNSTVQLSESRYFTDAADMLRHADPTRHKIVPRRRSSYFDDIQMLDREAIVPETSTPGPDEEMLDHAISSDLAILRRTSEAERTSQSLPAIPRDLRTLTRSVSRGHGTLSQSVRRRPSLPFQSPTKVR